MTEHKKVWLGGTPVDPMTAEIIISSIIIVLLFVLSLCASVEKHPTTERQRRLEKLKLDERMEKFKSFAEERDSIHDVHKGSLIGLCDFVIVFIIYFSNYLKI